MSKPTPGPWTASADNDGNWYITAAEDVGWTLLGVAEPDARLIAAAPDLLAALQGLLELDHIKRNAHLPGVERARAAIAKAVT